MTGRLTSALVVAWALAGVPVRAQERFELHGDKWQAQAVADPATPEGKLQNVRKLLAQDEAGDAVDAADEWIEAYPNHPLLAEAYLLRGDAKVADQDYYEALFDYEVVIRHYPASEQFMTALQREFEIARLYAAGVKRKILGLPIFPAYEEAAEIWIRIQERAPGSDLGERASLELANFYYRRGEMYNAVDAFDLFIINYPRSAHREQAMLQLIQAALATFRGPDFDVKGLIEAQERIRLYQLEYPASAERLGATALLVRIDESLAAKLMHSARWYVRRGDQVAAAAIYRRVLRDHPETAVAQDALAKLRELERRVDSAVPAEAPAE